MKCPACGAAQLVRDTCDLTHTYQGETITIPDVNGQFCPACGEAVLDADESARVSSAMLPINKVESDFTMELQVTLNTIASDVFRKQGDYDYIAARSNYRLQLRQQFLWSAHQAIEKYLKAVLLFNGKSARFYTPSGSTKPKEYLHNLDALLSNVKQITTFSLDITTDDERFLSYLSVHGGSNRYMSRSTYVLRDAIHRLDRLVWHLRRFCQYIPDRGLGCANPVPGMQRAFVRHLLAPHWKEQPHTFSIIGGELERVIKRQGKDPARKALLWANLWYGKKKRTTVVYDSFSSVEVAPIDREWPNVDWTRVVEYVKP